MWRILLGLAFVSSLGACGGGRGSGPPDADPDAVIADDARGDGPRGAQCGGFAGFQCEGAMEFCDFAENTCGISDGIGECQRRPDTCIEILRPVCACDGNVYANDCAAREAGFDLNANGGCAAPRGTFVCGYAVCNLQNEYCRRDSNAPAADAFTCVPLPQACNAGTPSCACLGSQPCGNACTGSASTGLKVTCT